MNAPSRNAPCPCGSGRRYKECHGAFGVDGRAAGAAPLADARRLMNEALANQTARRLDAAEGLYRQALAIVPDEPDALQMLGVIRYERGDLDEAKSLILRALDLTGWRIPSMRHNLSLVIARQSDAGGGEAAAARRRFRDFLAARRAVAPSPPPLVSVVVPSYNHAPYLEEALRSIFAQSYRALEIVVVDDGSTDGSPALAERCLRDAPFPHRLLAQANRGAPAAINEGLRLASGEFVNLLNSDDAFEPERIERMVAAVAGTGSAWGFSAIRIVDDRGAPADPLADRRAYDLLCSVGGIPHRESVAFALLSENVAVSSGNLFVSRRLAASLRGFRDYRYNHDWDFCLRAMREAEPVFVAEPLYRYRLHGANTIAQSPQGARAEAAVVCRDYLQWAATETAPANPVAPTVATWGTLFVNEILREGMGELIDPDALRHLARTGTLPQPVAAS
jgi:hypothetical protein